MRTLDLRNPAHLLATGFGSGLAPRAPGTVGTLAALALWWPLHFLSIELYWLVIAVGSIAGIYICGRTARDQGTHDHGSIVWDEFIGMWIALAWIPVSIAWVAAAFVLFRVLDIFKPWPISWFDKNVHGGVGIMIDDVVAGLIALALLRAAAAFI